MKKLILLFLLLLFIITGCNNNSSIYGKIDGEKYTNEKYGFSMDIPKDWEANPDTEKINVVNGKAVENPEELEVCFIRIMYPSKTRDNLVSVNNTLSIKEGISIYILSNQISLDEYVNDTYQTLSETYNDKIKKNYTKKINDKEIKVLEFSNNLIYLTQVEDNKILCIDATYSDKSKDKILNSFDSISFN